MKKITSQIILSVLLAGSLQAQNRSKTDDSDAILDRLERKLIEQEAKTLRLQTPPVRTDQASQRIEMPESPSSSIVAPLPEQRNFSAIDRDLLALEQDADDLSGQIEKLKADFQTQASKASFVEIIVELAAPQETSIRDLIFSINGQRIYSRTEQGAWVPGAQILLYSGPLEAGEHKIALQARTVRHYGEGLPLDQNIYHKYDENLSISLPEGTFRKGYRLKLAKPEQQNIHAKVAFESYEIR